MKAILVFHIHRRGAEAAVLVPIEEWRRRQAARPTLKELLFAETSRAEIPVPPRRRWHRRTPEALE
jgi:antitoxin Phd